MNKVIITKGLPGSGKTYWAKQMVADHPNSYKIVCKDDLRAMLDSGKWSPDSEKLILIIRNSIIIQALGHKKHVIIADTNLAPKHEQQIRALVEGLAEVEIKDFTDVPLETCIKQDLMREKSVGKDVIMEMYNRYLKPAPKKIVNDPKLSDIFICDVDGTLAFLNGRDPYNASTCENDLLNQPVVDLVNRFTDSTKVIFVSGRDEIYKQNTIKWLGKYLTNSGWFDDSNLFMRPTGDKRKDAIVKQEIYEREIKGKYNVLFVLDDRNQVVEMWRSLGLTCLQVAEGNF